MNIYILMTLRVMLHNYTKGIAPLSDPGMAQDVYLLILREDGNNLAIYDDLKKIREGKI